MFAFHRIIQRSAVVFVVLATALPAVAGQLRSELATIAKGSAMDVADEMLMRFSLSNDTDEAVYILTYQTPLAGFQNNLLVVERDGEPVDYIGVMAFRVGPTAEDWLRLEPGETVVTVFDLAQVYDVREPGFYTARYQALQHILNVRSEEQLPTVTPADIEKMRSIHDFVIPADLESVESNTISMFVTGSADSVLPRAWETGIAPQDSGCASWQSSTARSAQSTGVTQAYNSYFANQNSSSFFNTWFGTSYSTVQGNIARMYYRMRDRYYNYTCTSCGAIAYVYRGYPDQIWLCDGFWGYGGWLQGSVILHETSHWYVTAGTDDVVYGCSNAQSLSPYNKIRNADNYRCAGYYAP